MKKHIKKIDRRSATGMLIVVTIFILFVTVFMFQSNIMSKAVDRTQQEQFLDNHRETVMFYPDDAVYHLQKGLTGEGYPCEADGVLGNETITAYNEWRAKNEENENR